MFFREEAVCEDKKVQCSCKRPSRRCRVSAFFADARYVIEYKKIFDVAK